MMSTLTVSIVGPQSTAAGEHGAHARRLIARVTLHPRQQQVELIIYDQGYREELIKCFTPHFRFVAGGVTPEGYAWDAGEHIYPWEPAFIGVLESRLLELKLRCVPEHKLPLLSWLSRWRRHQGSGDRVLLTERDLGG
ncbi:MAG: hypothetical protein IMW90_17695 [Thermogemmatispora sp.]|jgi:hypothetical protein|uniref:hypothetical protein n=1 Tax=Thermogemmatispora sp. TaxID=1968838 RepID=UPI001A0762FF|nr:hypothetical protein [Thermogemmatispora sp.]MBE3567551.1 hypothetical protein [Thermogemmatispora sp.]